MTTAKKDPYTFVMHQKKLPMSLLKDMPVSNRTHVLATAPFENTFGPKSQRKRPTLGVESVEDLAQVKSNVKMLSTVVPFYNNQRQQC